MTEKGRRIFAGSMALVLLFTLVGAALGLFYAKENFSAAESQRKQALIAASILRQRSADLTMMARSFASTSDPIYEEFFFHIIGVSNGVWARPGIEDEGYWERALATGKLPDSSERPASNQAMIDRLEFSPEERKDLVAAESEISKLTELEVTAVKATRGLFVDDSGVFSVQKKPDLGYARKLLFDQSHHETTSEISRLLSRFSEEMNNQSKEGRSAYSQTQRICFTLLFAGLALVCFAWGWWSYKARKTLRKLEANLAVIQGKKKGKQSDQFYREIFDNVMASIYMKDLNGRFIVVNNRFVEVLGGSEDDYLGKTDFDLFPDALATSYRKNDQEVLTRGISIEFEERGHDSNREHRFTSVKFPVRDRDGKITGVCGISSDIKGLKQTTHGRAEWETKLRHSQKMEAVEQLTGGVAHDFNNILNIIHGNLELLKARLSKDEISLKRVENAMKGTARGAEITQKLFRFTQKQVHDVKMTNVNKVIDGLEGLISKSLPSSIFLKIQLEKELWTVAVDREDLENAILNLAINSRDSMTDGGTLFIDAQNLALDKDHALENSEIQEGNHVLISVSDTGCGFSEKVKEKVFEPFFTTKEQGKGTGLGLSMVYGFVKRSGGHLDVFSEVGEGTKVQIYLPHAPATEI